MKEFSLPPEARAFLLALADRVEHGHTDRMDKSIEDHIDDTLGWRPSVSLSDIDSMRQIIPHPCGSMSLATMFAVGGFADQRRHSAWAKVYFDTSMAGGPPRDPYESKNAASPALALCAAALRAMASGQMFCLKER